jgi:excinuclease ABC subunit C
MVPPIKLLEDAAPRRRTRAPGTARHSASPRRETRPSSPLRDHVRAYAENRPGVYRFIDREGQVLYVGKSVRVRARLLSYFRAEPGEKAHELIADSAGAEWEYVPDEFGALIREMRLIQRFKPRFNVQHKRKRAFAFLKLTLAEQAPRILAVSRAREDGSLYFGPFGRVWAVKEVARELGSVLGLRDCPSRTPVFWSDQMDLFAPQRSPGCMRAELGTCAAPCIGSTDEAGYWTRVRSARAFLQGASDEPLGALETRMKEAAARLDFEYAARLRDRRDRMAFLHSEMAAFRGEIDALSFVYRTQGFEGAERVYVIRGGLVRDEIDLGEAPGNAPRHELDPGRAEAAPPRARPRPGTGSSLLDEPDWDDEVDGGAGEEVRRASAFAPTVRRRVAAAFTDRHHGLSALKAHEADEVLLVAAWFRARPEERLRTMSPKEWLT